MMNTCVIVGRIDKLEEGKMYLIVNDTEQVPNIIPIVLKHKINDIINDTCNIGDLVGVKGNIREKMGILNIVADRVSILKRK